MICDWRKSEAVILSESPRRRVEGPAFVFSANLGKIPVAGSSSAADGLPTASEPNGAISYFEALEKQHGLKLVKKKRPEPVLVIDSIEQQPTEN